MKKYTLKEAFEKGFLWDQDWVDVNRLYNKPLRKIGYPPGSSVNTFRIISLEDVFVDILFCNPEDGYRPIGRVYLDKGSYVVNITWGLRTRYDNKEAVIVVANKLLTIEEFGIKATCYFAPAENAYKFNITLPSDVLVDFTDEKVPYLELPEHTAYILPKADS